MDINRDINLLQQKEEEIILSQPNHQLVCYRKEKKIKYA